MACNPILTISISGMLSLGRYRDGLFYRAVIVGAVDFRVHVFYCDYGDSDYIRRKDIYEIPAG